MSFYSKSLLLSLGILASINTSQALIAYQPVAAPFPVKGGGQLSEKFGYVNAKGQWVIKPQFDEADEFLNGFARVRIGDNWGAISKYGDMRVALKYPMVQVVKGGFFVVPTRLEGGAWRDISIFSPTGRRQFQNQYDGASLIGGGVWSLKTGNTYQLGFSKNSSILKTPYQYVQGSPRGWTLGKTLNKAAGRWQVVSPAGVVKAEFSADVVRSFNGYCAVAKTGKGTGATKLVNRAGKFVPNRTSIVRLGKAEHRGESIFFTAMTADRKYGLMNTNCRWITPPAFKQFGNTSDTMIAAKRNERWGYVVPGKAGWSINARFEQASSFEQTTNGPVAFAKTNGSWGLINASGQWVSKERFKYGSSFGKRTMAVTAVATDSGKELYGYLGTNGQWVIQPQFESATDFRNNYATVMTQGSHWLINRGGEKVKCLVGQCRSGAGTAPVSAEHIR